MPKVDVKTPPEALKRNKPLSNMVPCEDLPVLEDMIQVMPEGEQAKMILNAWAEAGRIHGDCAGRHDGLIEWIQSGNK